MCILSPTTSTHHSRNILNSLEIKSLFSYYLFLMNFLSTLKNSLIGLKSGEYGDKNSNTTPASRHICMTLSEWCQEALSITITDFGSGYLPQWCSNWAMKSSKQSLSVDPWYTRLSIMPSCAYAGRMCHRFPRPNFVTWTGEEPFGDHPQRLCPALPSQPDSSTKTS